MVFLAVGAWLVLGGETRATTGSLRIGGCFEMFALLSGGEAVGKLAGLVEDVGALDDCNVLLKVGVLLLNVPLSEAILDAAGEFV